MTKQVQSIASKLSSLFLSTTSFFKENAMKTRSRTNSVLMLAAVTVLLIASSADAALVQPVGATASSELAAGYEAVNVQNGNGLNAPFDETATHVAGSGSGTMWLSSNVGVSTSIGQFITFDLGSEFDLSDAYIWNYNQDGQGARGFNTYDIFVADSGGVFGAALITGATLNDAGGVAGELAQTQAMVASNVQFVKFVNGSNSANNVVGLSEVRFNSVEAPPGTAPEPSTLILAALGFVGLMGTRRRRNR